jgi:hypothetical protein
VAGLEDDDAGVGEMDDDGTSAERWRGHDTMGLVAEVGHHGRWTPMPRIGSPTHDLRGRDGRKHQDDTLAGG